MTVLKDLLTLEIYKNADTVTTSKFTGLTVSEGLIQVLIKTKTVTPIETTDRDLVLAATNNNRVPVYYPDYTPKMEIIPTDKIIGYEKKMITITDFGQAIDMEVDDLEKPIYETKLEQKTIGEYDMWVAMIWDQNLIPLKQAVTKGILRYYGLANEPLAWIEP